MWSSRDCTSRLGSFHLYLLTAPEVVVAPVDRPLPGRPGVTQAGDREPGVLAHATPRQPDLDDGDVPVCDISLDLSSSQRCSGTRSRAHRSDIR